MNSFLIQQLPYVVKKATVAKKVAAPSCQKS